MKFHRDNSFLCSLLYDRFYEDVVGCLKRAVTRILLLSNSSFHYSLFKSPAALIFSLLVFWIIRQWFIIISILHSITNRSSRNSQISRLRLFNCFLTRHLIIWNLLLSCTTYLWNGSTNYICYSKMLWLRLLPATRQRLWHNHGATAYSTRSTSWVLIFMRSMLFSSMTAIALFVNAIMIFFVRAAYPISVIPK